MRKLFITFNFICIVICCNAQTSGGIFKDIRNATMEHHNKKILHNIIAADLLISSSLLAYVKIIENKDADRNLASFLKPVSIVAGIAGIISAYSAGRHVYFKDKKIKAGVTNTDLGIVFNF